MVLDTSAVVAVLQGEDASSRLIEALEEAAVRRLSAATVVEAGIVMEARYGEPGSRELDLLVHRLSADVVAFTADQAELARSAFRRFGKGRHPARLNLGDCFAYALASSLGEPLLFVGDDFSQTDVTVARY